MGYKIGLDFGTTNSTLSYIDGSGNLETFRYPGPAGTDYIPSCVAYTKNDKYIRIGREALRVAANSDTEFYKNMKMVLPRPESEYQSLDWNGSKNPENVIIDYLSKILLSDKRGDYSFKKEIGEIDSIVVSVPQAWLTRQPNHQGRPKLEKIIKDKMNLPLIQLVSEPVAAAAYYNYWYKKESGNSFNGNILVCDMGGGTFDVTLCKLSENKVEVLKNDGNGIFDIGRAGVYFDTKLLKISNQREGIELDTNSPEFFEMYKKLQEYKVDCADFITDNIKTAELHPSYSKKLPVIESPVISYMYEIEEAFSEVKKGIEKVLNRFIENENIHIDKVLFVGGFNEFELTRQTIKNFLQSNREHISGDLEFVEEINSRMAAKAISFGATLIANEYIYVEELYPHTVGIVLEWKMINKEEENIKLVNQKTYIPLIKGKNKVSDYKEAAFHDDYLLAFEPHPKLTVYIQPGSSNNIAEKAIPKSANISLPNFSPENRWKVGMKMDESQIAYIVFTDEINNKESVHYELGNVLTEMFGLDGLVSSSD